MEKRATMLVSLLLLMVMMRIETVKSSVDCPQICNCSTWLSVPKASCTGQHLYSVYTGISNAVKALDLSNNSIGKLADRELSRVGLTRVSYLNLSTNAINEIGEKAFQDLKNLIVLDLSYNRIDYIAPDTFYDVRSLRTLHLAGNKFNGHVPKLHSDSIKDLYLSGCRIQHLPDDTFKDLVQLRKLDISMNHLTELAQDVLNPLPYLQQLIMWKNIWTCDAKFYRLKAYLQKRRIQLYVDPTCEMPAHFQRFIFYETSSTESVPSSITPELPNEVESSQTEDPYNLSINTWQQMIEQFESVDPAWKKCTSNFLSDAMGHRSPVWSLVCGFLLGCGATLLGSYLWLSTTIACLLRRVRRANATDATDTLGSQRVSLLRHLWTHESTANTQENNAGLSPTIILQEPLSSYSSSCPGTPPPPYREVMLHQNLYPLAAMVAVANQQRRTEPSTCT